MTKVVREIGCAGALACLLAGCSDPQPSGSGLREMSREERAAAEAQKAEAEQSMKDLRQSVLEQRVSRLEQDVAVLTARLDHDPGLAELAAPAPPIDAGTLPPLVPSAAAAAADAASKVPSPSIAAPSPQAAPAAKAPPARHPPQPRLTYDLGR